MKSFFVIVIFILTAHVNANAQSKKRNVKVRKTQEVNFEATEVDGALRSPDGAYVNPKKGVKFLPLYKVERRFDRDIKASVEYLK